MPIKLCLGIDPRPTTAGQSYDDFILCLQRHKDFLNLHKDALRGSILKPQFACFLVHGHKGLEALEEFADQYKADFPIILDAKFADISITLNSYLAFTFKTLGARGVTINPFFGEESLRMALELCAKSHGPEGRVYALCSTSEFSQGALSYFQSSWQIFLQTYAQIRREMFDEETQYHNLAGVVVGANRTNVLCSAELSQSGLGVLSPGLGAQGASWDVIPQVAECLPHNEVVFPLSRGIFAGGNMSVEEIATKYNEISKHFARECVSI